MELVVFAGGRGSRCGELTANRHKGAILFREQPLIHHVLSTFAELKDVTRILVITGYQQHTICEAVASFAKKNAGVCIETIDGPNAIVGTCRRLAYAIPYLTERNGCIVTGIDVLIHKSAAESLLRVVREDQCRYRALLLASQTNIAPTHLVARIQRGFVSELRPPVNAQEVGVCRDTGVRYVPQNDFAEIQQQLSVISGDISVSRYWATQMDVKRPIRAIVTYENWRHFASSDDFIE